MTHTVPIGPELDPVTPPGESGESDDEECQEEENDYQNLFWDGALPAADGEIARQFAKTPPAEQIELTTKVYTFLRALESNPLTLKAKSRQLTAMLSLPDSNHI